MEEVPPLVALGTLCIAWLCIALAQQINSVMKAVADHFPSPYGTFDWIKDGIRSAASWIAGELGKAESGIDAAIGASWHKLAWLTRELWAEIETAALSNFYLADYVLRLAYAHSGLRSLVQHREQVFHGIEHGVKDLHAAELKLQRRVRRLEREVSHGIGHDLRIGLRDLETEVHGIEQGTIPAIRSSVGAVEGELSSLERFIGTLPGVKYLDWAAGIVAAALGIEILNSLRCPSFLRSAKTRGCGLWNGLEDVLGLLVDVLLFGAFCDLWAEATPIFEAILDPVIGVIATFADGACSHPPGSFASFAVTEGSVPPPQTLGAIPA